MSEPIIFSYKFMCSFSCCLFSYFVILWKTIENTYNKHVFGIKEKIISCQKFINTVFFLVRQKPINFKNNYLISINFFLFMF